MNSATRPSYPANGTSLVFEFEEKPTTTSLIIAEKFGKEHYRVIRSIKNLKCSKEFIDANFGVNEYKDSIGRKLPMYKITRDGFIFLVTGFTGKKAAEWKEKFIRAFNEIEQKLIEDKIARKASAGSFTLEDYIKNLVGREIGRRLYGTQGEADQELIDLIKMVPKVHHDGLKYVCQRLIHKRHFMIFYNPNCDGDTGFKHAETG